MARNRVFWLALALTATSMPGCAEDADACTSLVGKPGNADHVVHVRMWSEETDDICVELSVDGRPTLGGFVPSRHPAPGQAREEPYIPRSFGSMGVDNPSSTVTVSVPEWGIQEQETMQWKEGENWLAVEVRHDGVRMTRYDEDPYGQAD